MAAKIFCEVINKHEIFNGKEGTKKGREKKKFLVSQKNLLPALPLLLDTAGNKRTFFLFELNRRVTNLIFVSFGIKIVHFCFLCV